MPDRSVVTRFEAKVDGYMAGTAKMKAGTEQVVKATGDAAVKSKAHWNAVGTASIAAGAVIGAVVVKAIKSFADFDAQMSRVAAVSGATAKEQAALAKAAVQAGQDTVFSATEAAKAQEELLKAGVATSDVLGGALKGSLDLAAAGGLDLAKSAEIAAQSMNIFNKSGSDVGHIADVLTAGANKSAAGVDDLGMALSQGGLLAKQTGLSLEETVGVLSAFADNALKGSDAGTSLKTMLQRLTPQSTEQAKAMEALNLSFYDAQGNFVGITETANRLQKAFANLTPEQRNSNLQTIFGSDAVRGANILMEQGAEGIRKYTAAVNDQGAAQRMASRMTDNLNGDLEQLRGTLESAFINGGSGGNDGLRSLVQGLTDLVQKFNDLDPSTQSFIVKAAAATAGALLLGGAAIKATSAVLSMSKGLKAAGVDMGALRGKAAGLAPVLARVALSLAAVANADALFGNSKAAINVTRLSGALADGEGSLRRINQAFSDAADFSMRADSGIRNVGDAFKASFDPSTAQQVDKFLGSVKGVFSGTDYSDIATAQERLAELDQTLAKMVTSGHADQAKAAFSDIARQAAFQGVSFKQVEDSLPGYYEALDSAAASAQGASEATGALNSDMLETGKAAQDAADGTKAFTDELKALNEPALDARSAARDVEQAFADATQSLKENGHSLDIHTEKGRKNQAALDDVASALNGQVAAMQANGASQATLDGKVDASRGRLEKLARQFGLSKTEAKKYIDQVLQTPKSVSTTFTAKTAQAKRDLAGIQANINRLRGLDIRIPVRYVETGPRPGGGRSTAGGITKAAGGAIYGPGSGTSDSIPARLSNGEHVLTASDVQKAGGQGAIYRMRAGIQSGVLRFANGGAVGFADGGEVDWSAIEEMLGDVTSWSDVLKARSTAASRASAVKSARASLLSLKTQLAHAKSLEQRRVLLAKVAAAEGRLSLAMSRSTAATRAAKAAVDEYDRDRRPLIDRTTAAAKSSNAVSKRFLDNIDKLTRMGFRTLALELLNQGGPEAESLAAAAVKSASKARSLESQLRASAALSSREQAIRDALMGVSAGSFTGDPNPLSFYSQVRDLGRLTPAIASVPFGGQGPTVIIQGALDPVGVGQQVEKVLQTYSSVTGKPVQISVAS